MLQRILLQADPGRVAPVAIGVQSVVMEDQTGVECLGWETLGIENPPRLMADVGQ
jgi:hypothetical protein